MYTNCRSLISSVREKKPGVLMAVAFTLLVLLSQTATAQVEYHYTGNKFNRFSCGGNILCQTPNPANTSYTTADFVAATLTLDQPLAPNLTLADVTGLPGFNLTMNDGHQQMVATAGYTGGFEAKVSTDAQGNITGPWSLIINCCFFPNNGISSLNWPGGRGVGDGGRLSAPTFNFPNTPSNSGSHILGSPGIWSFSEGGVGFGVVTRVIRQWQFSSFDSIDGDAGEVKSRLFTLSTRDGIQSARAYIIENGMNVGAWSTSYSGTARAIAFRTFRNITYETKTFKVKGVLEGRFRRAGFDLPSGRLSAAASIRVLNSTVFVDKLNASGVTAGEFLLGSYNLSAALDPIASFNNTLSLFSGGILGFGHTRARGAFDQQITTPVETGFVTVGPQQSFVVMFDIATYSLAGGGFDTIGVGSAYFHDSLTPAPDFFVGEDGQPITGIEALGPSAILPAPAIISLTPGTATNPIGSTHTVAALVTTAEGAPVPDELVTFEVISGPHAGLTGGAQTDANGQATFTYIGTQDAGTDTIRAQMGTLESNVVQKTWQVMSCPRGQGYWKNRKAPWPVSSLTLGSQTYTKAQLLEILKTPVRGDATLILAYQLIAAKLNLANGSDPSPSKVTIEAADNFLSGLSGRIPYNVKTNTAKGKAMTRIASALERYNNGQLTRRCSP